MNVLDSKLFSPMAHRIQPSKTLEVLELSRRLEQKGKKILHFELGEPDIPSPTSVKKALIEALEDNFTRYTVTRGILPLREKIAESFNKRLKKTPVNPQTEVIATPGSKTAIFFAMLILVSSTKDEIILNMPYWPTYEALVSFCGGKPVLVDSLSEEEGIDVSKIREAITDNTKIVILNFPNNPTSRTISKTKMKEIAELLLDYPDILVMSDEIYNDLTYSASDIYSFLQFEHLREQLILISGFSKSHSMTGYRLGYTIAPAPLVSKMAAIQGNSSTCPAAFVQKAGIRALDEENHIKKARQIFKTRAKLITDLLTEIPDKKVEILPPQAGFYAFPRIIGAKPDFAMQLLHTKGVAVTPGIAFGPAYGEHIRISFATKEEVIKEAMQLLKEFIAEQM